MPRIIYNDKKSSFPELLNKDSSISIQIFKLKTFEDLQPKCLGSIMDYHHHQ